jgi:hypothetical protein
LAVTNLKSKKGYVWIPPNQSAKWKIIITKNGNDYDVTNRIRFVSVKDYVTESIGEFRVAIYDPTGNLSRIFTGYEVFRYYKDYASTATTLRFRGRVERPSKQGYYLVLTGRREDANLQYRTVTKQFNNTECSSILSSLIASYAPGYTSTNVTVSTTNLTINFYQKGFWSCVRDLCEAAGFDCYADANLDFHFFEKGTITNTTEAIVHDNNLLGIEDFTPDISLVRNRIIVYGAFVDGIQVIYTAEDTTSQSSYGVRERIINDDNVTSYTQAQDLADYILSLEKDPPDTGKITSLLLATIQPGDSIRLSVPSADIDPGTYIMTGYEDVINYETGSLTTTVAVNKEPERISHIIRDRVEQENGFKQTSSNPEEMRYAYNFNYDVDSGSHTNTEIVDGVLKPTAGTGTWISPARSLPSNISEAYLILVGETLTGATVSVSGNNGVSYQEIANKSKIVLSSAVGSNLRIKVVFSSADTQIDSLSLQYKLS